MVHAINDPSLRMWSRAWFQCVLDDRFVSITLIYPFTFNTIDLNIWFALNWQMYSMCYEMPNMKSMFLYRYFLLSLCEYFEEKNEFEIHKKSIKVMICDWQPNMDTLLFAHTFCSSQTDMLHRNCKILR